MRTTLAALSLALLLIPASAADERVSSAPTKADSSFNCEGDRSLSMRFGSLNGQSIAAVTTDGERHVLALQPWDGIVPQVVWTDGARTLTWGVGVRIMWMNGAEHIACGRGAHNH